MEASANGGRVRFTRDVANIVMDLNDVETIDAKALGGADTVTVNDLSGHRPRRASTPDLAAPGGGDDAAADNVIVNATNGDDVVDRRRHRHRPRRSSASPARVDDLGRDRRQRPR